jgi:hypothetical protein
MTRLIPAKFTPKDNDHPSLRVSLSTHQLKALEQGQARKRVCSIERPLLHGYRFEQKGIVYGAKLKLHYLGNESALSDERLPYLARNEADLDYRDDRRTDSAYRVDAEETRMSECFFINDLLGRFFKRTKCTSLIATDAVVSLDGA